MEFQTNRPQTLLDFPVHWSGKGHRFLSKQPAILKLASLQTARDSMVAISDCTVMNCSKKIISSLIPQLKQFFISKITQGAKFSQAVEFSASKYLFEDAPYH